MKFCLLIMLVAAAASLPAAAQDQVVLDSPTGQLNGLIVWGKYSLTEFSREFRNQTSPVDVGDVGPCILIPCSANEVVAFTANRAPAWTQRSPAWDIGLDTVPMTYPPVVNLPVKVWVLCVDATCGPGPLSVTARTDILAKLASANLLFVDQTAGISLDLSDPNLIDDQMNNTAKKTQYQDFGTQCDQFLDLVNGMLDKNAINLYLVRSVENQFGRGQTCWLPNVAVLGYAFDAGLIAHEIGHDHWLQHSENFPELDDKGTKNIMNSLSNQRQYLSEGEAYRMHFEKFSVLNRKNKHYSNPPVQRPEARSCAVPLKTRPCAPIGTRLWVDP